MSPSSSSPTPGWACSAHLGLAVWILAPLSAAAPPAAFEAATGFGEGGGVFALLGIAAILVGLTLLIARVEGFTFLAPRASRGIGDSVQAFCSQRCRVEGRCPLTGTSAWAENCPLWAYVASDVPLQLYGSPFEPAKLPPVEA